MKKRRLLIGVGILLLVAGALAVVWFTQRENLGLSSNNTQDAPDSQPLTQEAAEKDYTRLEGRAPDEDADPQERRKYYEELSSLAASAGRCGDMKVAVEQLDEIGPRKNPMDALVLAECYWTTDNKTESRAWFDEAERRAGALPKGEERTAVVAQVELRRSIAESRE